MVSILIFFWFGCLLLFLSVKSMRRIQLNEIYLSETESQISASNDDIFVQGGTLSKGEKIEPF